MTEQNTSTFIRCVTYPETENGVQYTIEEESLKVKEVLTDERNE